MAISAFPPVSSADEHGLLAIGGDTEPESLLLAYSSGIFPWPLAEGVLAWFAPPRRAILRTEDFHLNRSTKKAIAHVNFELRINSDFEQVIRSCALANNRKGQSGTWITSEIIEGYIALHELGFAHSVECYCENELVGGLYGVSIGGMFAGESMFYRKSNASKYCLMKLIELARREGLTWIDCQVMTPLFESFGATEVHRDDFMQMLATALSKPQISFQEVLR